VEAAVAEEAVVVAEEAVDVAAGVDATKSLKLVEK
jgi:hypothetical protein